MSIALAEAQRGRTEGGIPIGSCLVVRGQVVGAGHNRRVQQGNPILHGEMDALQAAGRLSAKDYSESVIYTTLSPCHMCSGAILLYKIPRVVLAENETFLGAEDLLRSHGVEVINMQLAEAVDMMKSFIAECPHLWNEDIGVIDP
jgi:cytosine/creatinine deaminase